MCLSTVYAVSPMSEGREKLFEYVSTVRAQEGSVVLTDIMGVEKVIHGVIRSLDLVNNEILVETKKEA